MSKSDKELLDKMNQIDQKLDQLGTNSPTTPKNSEVIDSVLKQQDWLMKRLEEIENRENKREQKNNQLLKKLEDSTSNFDTATQNTEQRFKNVARHYIERIDTDNLEQDFQQALDTKFKQVDNKADELFSYYETANKQVQDKMDQHQKTIDNGLKNNDKLAKTYEKALKVMSKGLVAMFFVILIMALINLATGPIGDFLRIGNFYDTLHQTITQAQTNWKYLIYIAYVVPYILMFLLIWACMHFLKLIDIDLRH